MKNNLNVRYEKQGDYFIPCVTTNKDIYILGCGQIVIVNISNNFIEYDITIF